jgi:transaldolase / glucose-6-phosphate isomerase
MQQPGSGVAGIDATLPASLGALAEAVNGARLDAVGAHVRLCAGDASLWPIGSAGSADAWLGWMQGPARAAQHLAAIIPLVEGLLEDGVRDVVLTGMGGSSLFPEVLARAFGSAPGHPMLHVLDSTDPAAVRALEQRVAWSDLAVIAASKSGTTVETRAHLARFAAHLEAVHGPAGGAARTIALTDPGSALEQLARERGYRAVVHGDPDVGGRYSALSPFGLLPAALLGLDLQGFLSGTVDAVARWAVDPWSHGGPALLATVLAKALEVGRDAMHLLLPEDAGGFGAWVEQLVAESSGKGGTGVLPVVVASAADVVATERAVVVALGSHTGLDALIDAGVPVLQLGWDGPRSLGAEAMRWMRATALLCARIGVDPFDQPDVAAAKAATAAALADGAQLGATVGLAQVEGLGAAAYVALLAYVDPGGEDVARVEAAARRVAHEHRVPVTVGIGPRYLHSTGQLHKGGRADGRFLVIVGDDPADVTVPGQPYGFRALKRAQAAGDLAALRAAGRRADLVDVTTLGD